MERLRGKVKADVPTIAEAPARKKYEKAPKCETNTETRPLDVLIREFEASAGNFDEFHTTMNGREKILFKGYIHSMREVKA